MTSQDIDNLNESYYILEKHKQMNENLTYKHCMDGGMETKDAQTYEEKHNQEMILKDIRKDSYN
jgi:hypothetical protein